jgi:hypothetical protein
MNRGDNLSATPSLRPATSPHLSREFRVAPLLIQEGRRLAPEGGYRHAAGQRQLRQHFWRLGAD